MSRQDNLDIPEIDDVPRELPLDDDQLQLDVRLGLDEIAAAEEERLRVAPRRQPTKRELVQLASSLFEARRRRDRVFNGALFGEPAWDMLLALYCLPPRGIILTATSLCYSAEVPPSTGSRWQKLLLDQGLIKRGPDISDGRQQLVALSESGRSRMERYLVRLYYCREIPVPELD